ncbi:hypothetical protein HK405_008595, partial [Cladochytrium tenue]
MSPVVLSFHDSELSSHLSQMQLTTDLFSIPWFMTLFSHIYQLDKIYNLWDAVLVRPPIFTVFVAFGIVRQLRDTLLQKDFSSVFSEPLAVDVEKSIADAIEAFRTTPTSLAVHMRSHGHPPPLSGCVSFEDFTALRGGALLVDLRQPEETKPPEKLTFLTESRKRTFGVNEAISDGYLNLKDDKLPTQLFFICSGLDRDTQLLVFLSVVGLSVIPPLLSVAGVLAGGLELQQHSR